MKTPRLLLATLFSMLVSFGITGCDRTISKEEKTTTSSDGTQKSKETTVTQKPDGTIEKKEETKKTTPAKP